MALLLACAAAFATAEGVGLAVASRARVAGAGAAARVAHTIVYAKRESEDIRARPGPRARPEECPDDDTADLAFFQTTSRTFPGRKSSRSEPFARREKTAPLSEGSSRGSTAPVPHTVAHGAHPRAVPSTRHPHASPHVARLYTHRPNATPSLVETCARFLAARIFLDGTSSRPKPCTSRRCASMGSSRTRSARSCPRSTPCSTPSPA